VLFDISRVLRFSKLIAPPKSAPDLEIIQFDNVKVLDSALIAPPNSFHEFLRERFVNVTEEIYI
jgi:hypothetical protein